MNKLEAIFTSQVATNIYTVFLTAWGLYVVLWLGKRTLIALFRITGLLALFVLMLPKKTKQGKK
jgi:hypothetical protein